jgi:anti-anti-sigma factor
VPDLSVEVRHLIDEGTRPDFIDAPAPIATQPSTAGPRGDRMLRTKTARTRTGTQSWSFTKHELTLSTRQAGACTILDVSGRMTIDSSFHLRPVLHAAVEAASPAGVVIDCTRTTYLDTCAAATVIDAAMLAHGRGVPVRLVGLSGQPRLLAEVIELDRIFRALGSAVEFV